MLYIAQLIMRERSNPYKSEKFISTLQRKQEAPSTNSHELLRKSAAALE